MAALEQELLDQIRQLNVEQQRKVLDFVQTLTYPQGIPGEDLVARAHQINFDPADLEEMKLEVGCEGIESEEGELGGDIIQHARDMQFPREDLQEISRLVQENEERIDWDDWNNPPTLSS